MDSVETVIKTRNLRKTYGDVLAVDDLSIDIFKGEIFGFLGPNGAGKTTSINMMCGLLRPEAGQVLLHGNPINGGDRSLRSRVGMCPSISCSESD